MSCVMRLFGSAAKLEGKCFVVVTDMFSNEHSECCPYPIGVTNCFMNGKGRVGWDRSAWRRVRWHYGGVCSGADNEQSAFNKALHPTLHLIRIPTRIMD